MIRVLAFTRELRPLGLVRGWLDASYTIRHRRVGSWVLTVPAWPDVSERIPDGCLLAFQRRYPRPGEPGAFDWVSECSGPLDEPLREWAAGDEQTGGPGRYTLTGGDGLALIAAREAWPDPASPLQAQTTAYWTRVDVPAEQIVTDLVSANAGPTARPERRVAGLAVAPPLGYGRMTRTRARGDLLLDIARPVAMRGSIGFRCLLDDNAAQLRFETFPERYRTGSAYFAQQLGSVRAYALGSTRPLRNTASIAGAGSGTSRVLREYVDAESVARWGRIEGGWVESSDGTSEADYAEDGQRSLLDGSPAPTFTAVVADTPLLRYGPDLPGLGPHGENVTGYQVGDWVGVAVAGQDAPLQNVITEVTVSASGQGVERVTTVVGGSGGEDEPAPVPLRVIRDFERRLGRLERV